MIKTNGTVGKVSAEDYFKGLLSDVFNRVKEVSLKIDISHILLISLALHLFVMSFPSDGGMIFDEAHYIPAARATLLLQPANVEHTPLTKILIALSIAVFGDYWFAWRFPIVVTSVISLYVFYCIAKRFLHKNYALIATSFLLFDPLFFTHGSIAILDMPAVLFGLCGIYLFLSKKYGWSAVSFGVSFLMKELGLLFLFSTLLYHTFKNLTQPRLLDTTKNLRKHTSIKTKTNLKKFLKFFCVLILIGIGALQLYDTIYKPYTSSGVQTSIKEIVYVNENKTPITTTTMTTNTTTHQYIGTAVDHLKFAFSYFSGLAPVVQTPEVDFRPPWSWILPFPQSFNEPKYFTVALHIGDQTKLLINWRSPINPTIYFFTLPIIGVCFYKFISERKHLPIFLLSWILFTYTPWLLIGIFIQRMTFNYYFLYTVPALTLGISYLYSFLKTNKLKQTITVLHLLACIVIFVYYFPVVLIR